MIFKESYYHKHLKSNFQLCTEKTSKNEKRQKHPYFLKALHHYSSTIDEINPYKSIIFEKCHF
jgi:hypothetical protein